MKTQITPRLEKACRNFIDNVDQEWGDIEIESALIESGLMAEDEQVDEVVPVIAPDGWFAVQVIIPREHGGVLQITPARHHLPAVLRVG